MRNHNKKLNPSLKEPDDIEIEDGDEKEEDSVIPFKYSITSYGADYTVDGLVKRVNEGSIFIPSFQRGFVWSFNQASRFIESLLLGLPVPGIFLSKEQETQKLLVIDGQQRLFTLKYFYEGIFHNTNREFALRGVQNQFNDITYKTLQGKDRRALDDSILHATIIKQDAPPSDKSSIYHIFERLNTGGMLLQPQEIRACIYHGKFNDLLRDLNKDKYWRSIFGKVHSRMRDQEMILRFLSFYHRDDLYKKPIKGFLNEFMGENKDLQKYSGDEIKELFCDTIKIIHEVIGINVFKPKKRFMAAFFDAAMVGIARRLKKGHIQNTKELKSQYEKLLKNKDFRDAISEHTSDEVNVKKRIEMATKFFSEIK